MDWSDEVKARLDEDIFAAGDATGALAEAYADDIRAALEEIERRGLQYPDDLGISRDAAGLSARCAELRDRLVAQGKRAEAAEAEVERLRAEEPLAAQQYHTWVETVKLWRKRAEAAEDRLAEVTRIARASEECARAERIRCRDEWAKSEAEVERLTTTVAHLSKRASEYEADRDRNAALCMDAVADANRLRDLILWCESDDSEEGHAWDALMDEARKIRAALRGGGE